MNIQDITYPSFYKDNRERWFGLLSADTAFQIFDGETFTAIINASTQAALAGTNELVECTKEEFEYHYERARIGTHFQWANFCTPHHA